MTYFIFFILFWISKFSTVTIYCFDNQEEYLKMLKKKSGLHVEVLQKTEYIFLIFAPSWNHTNKESKGVKII